MGDGTPAVVPEEVVGITGALEVDLENDVSCARLSDKTIKCWGIISSSLGYGEGPVSAPVYDITSTKSLSLGANTPVLFLRTDQPNVGVMVVLEELVTQAVGLILFQFITNASRHHRV